METVQNYTIRPFQADDQAFLSTMLYQAIFVPEGSQPPPPNVVELPELSKYVCNFGHQPGDLAYIVVDNATQQLIGATWLRLFSGDHKGYGYVDDSTPELSIAIDPQHRGRGIGHALLTALLTAAQKSYRAVSLNVWVENPALRLYQRLGFETVTANGPEMTMIKRFSD
ncbi:MAG: GNAT family N-acetyltransferase [Chloroflexi bacterium]|nr:GNAT family N-acetyltransferase [Chloroflexota bacterium]